MRLSKDLRAAVKAHEKALEALGKEAEKELERRARRILAAHPNLDEFVCAMGVWFFTVPKEVNEPWAGKRDNLAYFAPVRNFLEEFDELLHLTGWGVRFTAHGPKQF